MNSRLAWSWYFFFIIHSLFATNVKVEFTGLEKVPILFKLYAFEGLEKKEILFESIVRNDTVLECFIPTPRKGMFYTFSINERSHNEVYFLPNQNYHFKYNNLNKELEALGDNNWENQLSNTISKKFNTIVLNFCEDSTVLHQKMQYLKESQEYKELKNRMLYNNIDRRWSNSFCNFAWGCKLFKPNLADNSRTSKEILEGFDLQNIDLELGSSVDRFALRQFHMYNQAAIQKIRVPNAVGIHLLYLQTEEWLKEQDLSDTLQCFILGDLITFYWVFPHAINKEERKYLENFLERFPNSRHRKIIREELDKPVDEATTLSLFNPSMKNILGKAFDLHQVKEKVILVDLWASWCGPCIKEFPYLKFLEEEFKGKVKFLKISIDTDFNKWQDANKKHEIEEENSYFLEKEALDEFTSIYSISAIPRYLMVRKNGRIIHDNFYHPQDPKAKELLQKTVALP